MSERRYYIGIDPGMDGGYVVVNDEGRVVLSSKFPMVDKEYNINSLCHGLREVKTLYPGVKGAIEKVGAAPGQGVVSMFKFGLGTGILIGILGCLEIPFTQVRPQAWQSVVGAPKVNNKKTSPRVALELFPGQLGGWLNRNGRLDDGIADAVLIAEWARRNMK